MGNDYNYAETLSGVRVLENTIIKTDKGDINAQELFRLLGVLKNTVDATLTSIEQSVASVEGTVSDVATLKTTVASLSTNVNQNGTQISTINTSVTNIQDTLGVMSTTLTSNKNKITTLQSDIVVLQDEMGLLNTSISGNLTKINDILTRLQTIDVTITNINTDITTINGTLTSQATQISVINGKLNSLTIFKNDTIQSLSTINASINSINTTLTNVDTSITTITADIQTINTSISSHNVKILALETLTQTHDTKLTTVISETAINKTDIANITTTVNGVVQTANNNKTDITTIKQSLLNEKAATTANTDAITINKTDITNINTSINGINQSITVIKSDIINNNTDIVSLQTGLTATDTKNLAQDTRLDALDVKTNTTNQDVLSLKSNNDRLKASVSVATNTSDDVLKSVIKHTQSSVYIDTGVDNAFVVNRPHVTNDLFALFDNLSIDFIAYNNSTTASTLSVNGSAPLPIKKNGNPLKDGDIVSGYIYKAVFDVTGNIWNLYDIETQSERYDTLNKVSENLKFTGKISYINSRFAWRENIIANSIYVTSIGNPFDIMMPAIGDIIYNIGATGNILTTSVTVDADGIPLANGASLIARLSSDFSTYQLLISDGGARSVKTRIGDIVLATATSNLNSSQVVCCDNRAVAINCVSFPNTEWLSLPLLNGWVTYGASFQLPQYRMIDDMVEIRGLIKNGLFTTGINVFQLPADFRIKKTLIHRPYTAGGYANTRIDIKNSGVGVIIRFYTNSYVVLDIKYSIN